MSDVYEYAGDEELLVIPEDAQTKVQFRNYVFLVLDTQSIDGDGVGSMDDVNLTGLVEDFVNDVLNGKSYIYAFPAGNHALWDWAVDCAQMWLDQWLNSNDDWWEDESDEYDDES